MKLSRLQNINLDSKLISNSLWIAIILYPFCFIWQGGDLTDTGFFAVNYHFYFENLGLGETNSTFFLTDFIGANWLKLFPGLGILGLKFLWLIVFYAIIRLTYVMLKGLTENTTILLIGIFCGVAFATRFTMFVFSYDIASWLFLLTTGYLLTKSIKSNKLWLFYLSGLTLCLAFLCRFPNIVFILLLPAILYFTNAHQENRKFPKFLGTMLSQYSIFILGFVSMTLLFIGTLEYFDLTEVFISNLDFVKNSFEAKQASSHSVWSLIRQNLSELFLFIPHLIAVATTIITTTLIYGYSKTRQKYFPIIIWTCLVLCAAFQIYTDPSYTSKVKYLIPAICFFPLLYALSKKNRLGSAVLLLSTIAITQVAGSNTGLFLKLTFGFTALIPLVFIILSQKKQFTIENIVINSRLLLIITACSILFFSVWARLRWIYHVDSGLTSRLKAVHTIENSQMKGIFTAQENASHIKTLHDAIENNISEGNNLFIYGHQPLFYYLTKHHPAIRKHWLSNNNIQVEELFSSLNESILKTNKWPLIVDTKEQILGEFGENELSVFLTKQNYSCVEDEVNYRIWKKV